MTYDDLVKHLPRCGGSERFSLVQAKPDFIYHTRSLPEFVPPILSDRADLENPAEPSVLVISAAGAVGKSTLAREIAISTSAPLWDLSLSKPVGQHTFLGQLSDAFGPQAFPEVHKAILEGTFTIVIDALDEARVRVSEASFEAFLEDIATLAVADRRVRLVLLGRVQVAETAWLILQGLQVPVALYVIEPFSKEMAVTYVERRVRVLDPKHWGAETDFPEAFHEARQLIFSRLQDAIVATLNVPTDEDIMSFLGYAPVLDAIAVLLAKEENLFAFCNRLRQPLPGPGGRYSSVNLLRHIVERILQREQEDKLVKNIRPALELLAQQHKWSDWGSLYSRDEQCARLLGRILDFQGQQVQPLPPQLAAVYEERLAGWLPEHPFLRDGRHPANVVFESYLFARAMLEDVGAARGAVQSRVRDPTYKPAKLLADFYLLAKHEEGVDLVPGDHLPVLYDSMLAGESGSLYVRISVDGLDPDDIEEDGVASTVEVDLDLITPQVGSGDHPRIDTVSFQTAVTRNSAVMFPRYIRDATITLPCTVILGSAGQEFEIGPAVRIRCARLRITAGTLIVGGRTTPRVVEHDDPGVMLDAEVCESTLVASPIVHVPFQVSWPDARQFPWTAFAAPTLRVVGADGRVETAYRRFRRIVMTLRSHGKGSLARYRDKVEHQRVLKGPAGQVVLATLIGDGILVLRESFYHWDPVRAGELLRVSWLDLRRGAINPTLTAYLQRIVTRNAHAFA